jgi:predicted dehydrogenase
MSKQQVSRRRFLKTGALAALGGWAVPNIIPARVLGREGTTPPSEKVAVGLIGCGGIAGGQASYGGPKAAVAAVCDVWNERRLKFKERYGNCPDFVDFRELLARPDLDAVHVSTPDHWHVAMAVLAAEAGKHMVIEKPFSMSVGGLLATDNALHGKKLAFQFHAESRSSARTHKFLELALNGYVGAIKEAFVWGPGGTKNQFAPKEEPLPADWGNYDLWLGPAPAAPYSGWRTSVAGIWNMSDYSLGMLTNWGIHPVNIFQWWADVAGLGVPVEYAGVTEMNSSPAFHNVTEWDVVLRYANGFTARFLSPAKAVPHQVPAFDPELKPGPPHGVTLIGEKGWLHWDYHGISSSVAPYEDMMRVQIPDARRPFRAPPRGHNDDFIEAIKAGA